MKISRKEMNKVTKDCHFSLTTIVLPMIESRPVREIILSVMSILATLSAPAVTFPRSPTCLLQRKNETTLLLSRGVNMETLKEKIWNSNCVFILFTAFPIDAGFPHDHLYYSKVIKYQSKDR